MPLFYQVSDKEMVQARNGLFRERGIPALQQQHFVPTPFSSSWFGRDNLGGYTYEFCRIAPGSHLEMVQVHISKGDRWVKCFLNIFLLQPPLVSVEALRQEDGMPFHLPPHSRSEMRLRIDDIKTIPLFNLWGKQHKVGAYFSQRGFDNQCAALGELLHRDLNDINRFVTRWHELHQPLVVKWNGEIITF